MATVTMFFQHEYYHNRNTFTLYLPDYTYPDVPEEVAKAICEAGHGEIVPDSILGPDAPHSTEMPAKTPRRKVSKRWQ